MRFRKLRIAWTAFWCIACLLLIVLWVRSNHLIEEAEIEPLAGKRFVALSREGRLEIRIEFGVNGRPAKFISFPRKNVTGPAMRKSWQFGNDSFPKLSSHYFVMPYWFVVFLAGVISAMPWIRWQFSLRTLLIATTFVAVVLGLAVYAVSK